MKIEPSYIISTLAFKLLFIIQSNAAATIGLTKTLSNSVISNYRIQPNERLASEKEVHLIKYLGFVTKEDGQIKDGQNGQNYTVTVELHPNDGLALDRCHPRALLYELINFQLQLYLSIEKTSVQSDLLPVCERVEKCVGSMYSIASRSETFQERLFSPILLMLKQTIKLVCNMERKESKMNVNSIVDTTQTLYNNVMMIKNVMKSVIDLGLF